MRAGMFKQATEAEMRAYLLMRAANDPTKRWRGRLAIPKRCHPLVRALYETLNTQRVTIKEVAKASGVQRKTISGWRASRNPMLPMFVAVANALDFDVVLKPRRRSGPE